MAVLVAIGGAALGSVIPGIGANAGWIIGSIVGTLLFPPSVADSTREGPRLGDLTVTSSAYGQPIPISFGTIRMAGNMIWSTGIEEQKTSSSQKTGGKGGLGATQTTVTYEYFATFALGFAEGEQEDVLRMWVDGKLIYDKTGTSDDIQKVDLNFTFYPGSETQLPDSLIEADIGENQTPAFRGLNYIVFDRLPLKDFGNRIPNITAEITSRAQDTQSVQEVDFFTVAEGGLTDIFSTDNIYPDYVRSVFYAMRSSDASNILRRFDTRTMSENRQKDLRNVEYSPGNDIRFANIEAIAPNSQMVITVDSGNSRPLALFDPDTLEIVDVFGSVSTGTTLNPVRFAALREGANSWCEVLGPEGPEFYFLAGSLLSRDFGLVRMSQTTFDYVWDSNTDPASSFLGSDTVGSCAGAVGNNFGECYALTQDTGTLYLHKITVNAGAFFAPTALVTNGVNTTLVATVTAASILPSGRPLSVLSEGSSTTLLTIT